MSQKIDYCPAGHSNNDRISIFRNNVDPRGTCEICTKERFIQEFKTWSSGNANIDKIIQESQINSVFDKLQWFPYNNFQNINHIADGGHGSVYSAKLENGIKENWNFIKQDWEYNLMGHKVALKEIKDSRIVIVQFLKAIRTRNEDGGFSIYYGISKNPSTQNYIFVMYLFDGSLDNFLTKTFWDLDWVTKILILGSIADFLVETHEKNLIHCDLRSGNILTAYKFDFRCGYFDSHLGFDLSSCKLENDLVLNSNNNIICGSIPYIPPEVLIGNEFTREGDIYSFGGIMYEIVAAQRPFADQAHDTYLMIDICNGVRPKVPDFMLNWTPEWYLDLMYRCWSDDPSERPTASELFNLFFDVSSKLYDGVFDNNLMRQLEIAIENLEIAIENQENTSKSQLHPQSCYISRYIYTLHGLQYLLEEIKSGKSSDPNIPKSNNQQP
ncbi:hypothetical protein Glove_155g105 [Diversispora epigaea]|uniref:Protein kinase domain-containing protein n=1 Tax=Diversispora epigaea TaxID=1348612 RepID=A0A397IS95_9GLOM|nr:hypothetical protein Glove_155g105 [Diversispora epigaea]